LVECILGSDLEPTRGLDIRYYDVASDEDLKNIELVRLEGAARDTETAKRPAFEDAEFVNDRDKDGYTALHWAVHKGNKSVVRYFLQHVPIANFGMTVSRTP
jgi:ankyrin repeat protein